jgi:hypothetical protein
MSAFVVENELLDFVLDFARQQPHGGAYIYRPSTHQHMPVDTPEALSAIGQILHDENVRSVNCRYREEEAADPYVWKPHAAAGVQFRAYAPADRLTRAVAVLKALACFDYQACETDDYGTTDAAAIVRYLREAAIHALPGYDAAKWGAPDAPAADPDAPKLIRLI